MSHIVSSIFWLLVQPEHQQLIVDAGALPHLVGLLKRHRDGQNSRAVNGVIRRAADAITNLAHENSSIKTCVRFVCFLALFESYIQCCIITVYILVLHPGLKVEFHSLLNWLILET